MDDGSFVEGHAVQEQPAVQRLSVLLLSVGVEGSGERTTAAEETHRQGEESIARTTRQVRNKEQQHGITIKIIFYVALLKQHYSVLLYKKIIVGAKSRGKLNIRPLKV